MAKNCLASLGLIFLALLAALGATLALAFFDLTGSGPPLALPGGLPVIAIDGTPVLSAYATPDISQVQTLVSSGPQIQLLNPLENRAALPAGQSTPTPPDTPTPLPPLDPLVYRTEVMLRLKHFGAALEEFMAGNDELAADSTLLHQDAWLAKMAAAADDVASSGRALGEVGPPPPEYVAINEWLRRAGPEAEGLRDNYRQALEGGDAAAFTAAADNFSRIKAYLFAALDEMAKAGWPVE